MVTKYNSYFRIICNILSWNMGTWLPFRKDKLVFVKFEKTTVTTAESKSSFQSVRCQEWYFVMKLGYHYFDISFYSLYVECYFITEKNNRGPTKQSTSEHNCTYVNTAFSPSDCSKSFTFRVSNSFALIIHMLTFVRVTNFKQPPSRIHIHFPQPGSVSVRNVVMQSGGCTWCQHSRFFSLNVGEWFQQQYCVVIVGFYAHTLPKMIF